MLEAAERDHFTGDRLDISDVVQRQIARAPHQLSQGRPKV